MNLGSYIFSVGLDDKEFTSGMKKVDTSLSTFGKSATATGKSLTKNLTLPITLAAGAAIKLAADFEVASRKFSGAFKGAEVEASSAVESLSENFGIASSEATQLLGYTGDLLKGFGATSTQALELATSTNEVAIALAAYNGVPVAQAANAATKALLGETESLKSLGVVIRQSDVDARLAAKGLGELEGSARLLAKSQVTLELITEQSSDAINNFADNTNTLSFQTQALLGDLKDLGVQFGTILLPVIKDIVGQAGELVDWLGSMDASTAEFVLTLLAVAAAAGPAVTAIGAISTALAFMAANPIVLAVAGVAALTTVVVALGAKNNRDNISALTTEFSDLAKETGVADDEMKDFVLTIDAVQGALERGDFMATFESIAEQVEQLRQNTGLTVEQILKAGLASDNLSANMTDILTTLLEEEKAFNNHEASLLEIAIQSNTIKETIEEQVIAEEEVNTNLLEQEASRQRIEDKYQEAWVIYQQIIEGEKTQLELLDEQILRFEALSDASEEYNLAQQEALDILKTKRDEIYIQQQAEIDAVKDKELADDKKRLADYLKAALAMVAAQRKAAAEAAAERKAQILAEIDTYATMTGSVATLFGNLIQLQLDGDEEITDEKKKQIRVLYRIQQAAAIAQIAIDAATAVIKGYAQLGPIGGTIAAVVIAALAGTQIALVASTPPPLAEGGVLEATNGGRIVQVAEAGDDEAVIPLNDKFFSQFREKVLGSTTGSVTDVDGTEDGSPVVLQNIMDGELISQTVVGYVNNKTAGTQIRSTSIVNR